MNMLIFIKQQMKTQQILMQLQIQTQQNQQQIKKMYER